jgi:rare lipoprotein A
MSRFRRSPASAFLSAAIAIPLVIATQTPPIAAPHYKVGQPYQIAGKWYYPKAEPAYDRQGIASWYGAGFHRGPTANGEVYDMHGLNAAHPTLPLPSYAYVTNLANGRQLLVRINNRGPFVGDRLIDLSVRAAKLLGTYDQGLERVRVTYAGRAPLSGGEVEERKFLLAQAWYKAPAATAVASAPAVQTAPLRPTVVAMAPVARRAAPDKPPADGIRLVAQLESEAVAEVEGVWRDAMRTVNRKPWR